MGIKSDPGIIRFCFRRSQQDDLRFGPQPRLRQTNQLPSDSLLLVGLVHGQVGKIAAILEIGNRTGNSHQLAAVPGGAEQVRVLEHRFDAPGVIYRPTFGKRRTLQQLHKLRFANSADVLVSNLHVSPERGAERRAAREPQPGTDTNRRVRSSKS